MKDYIVLLKEEAAVPDGHGAHAGVVSAGLKKAPPRGRSGVIEAGAARTAEFQHKLREFLKGQGVADQVSRIGEPSVFPMVALTSTPEVASLIQTLPEVEAVVPDRDEMHLLP
jgi:hypothetical protein